MGVEESSTERVDQQKQHHGTNSSSRNLMREAAAFCCDMNELKFSSSRNLIFGSQS